jgi:putative ABC transport system ATP-binding protein
VGTGSASYLRRLIAYVPQRLADNAMRCLNFATPSGIKIKRGIEAARSCLDTMAELNLPPALYDRMLSELEVEQLQTILISLLPLTRRPIILIDSLPDSENVYRFVHELAQNGAEVLYTCEHQSMPCDKLIKL